MNEENEYNLALKQLLYQLEKMKEDNEKLLEIAKYLIENE